MTPVHAKPLIAYYGDDFTGSTDVMEALASNGIETVLFLRPPSAELQARFSDAQAIGLAGTSRSETPAWMDAHLPAVFGWLKRLDASLYHYKVCSTFDSAPHVGNIGRAIEIGRNVFGTRTVPIVVGAPQIRRYTAFGHLFAAYHGEIYRIDRHPVMSRHPVTPMAESDVLRHLAAQTPLAGTRLDPLHSEHAPLPDTPLVLLDVCNTDQQEAAGRLLWSHRDAARFVCGSSGVEYAIVAALRAAGYLPAKLDFPAAGPVDQIAVVSGSVSPTTERQIRHALESGFDGIALDPVRLAANDGIEAAVSDGMASLATGRSVILYTALGPGEDKGSNLSGPDARRRIGEALGRIQKVLVSRAGLSRAVVAGGDTSSHALTAMDIGALTLKMPLPQTPGSPLCDAHGLDLPLEIALKGGQVGHDDYFSMIRAGRPT